MYVNVQWVCEWIERVKWAPGDRAIVLVSSISAEDPALNQSLAYNLSKACLNQMARYYAKVLTARINAVSPATFTGPSSVVTPQQVANVIAYLLSPWSTQNGQIIRVA